MSLLELIAKRSKIDRSAFSLPDLLAEQALARLPDKSKTEVNGLISEFFAAELLRDTPDKAREYANVLLEHGVSEDRFLKGYVAGAADVLGTAWEDDRISFAMVTHAMGQLMDVAREMMSLPPAEPYLRPDRPRVLLARTPGEDHTLGLLITAQDMRKRGWLVRVDLTGDIAALSAASRAQSFNLVGFTASTPERQGALTTAIQQIRRYQQDSKIVTGGGLGDDPDLAAAVGADLALGRDRNSVETLIHRFQLASA